MRIDHLNGLRALEAVLRKGGLRPAAQDLGVTPAAVGQQIRQLEDYLGVALLDRHPTGATPTQRAENVAAELTRHMMGLGDVATQLKATRDPNRIAISVLPSFADGWLQPFVGQIFAQFSGIDLRLDASRTVVNLYDGAFDFAVRYTNTPGPDVNATLLLDDYCAPICTPAFAARYALAPSAPSLADVPMAEIDLAKVRSAGAVPSLVDWCKLYGIAPPSPQSGQMTLDYSAGLNMAASGLAVFLAGLHDVLDELESETVVLPLGKDRVLLNPNKFWLVWRKDRRLSKVQSEFVDWIGHHAEKDRQRISRYLAD